MGTSSTLDSEMVLAGYEHAWDYYRRWPTFRPDAAGLLGLMSAEVGPAFRHGMTLASQGFHGIQTLAIRLRDESL